MYPIHKMVMAKLAEHHGLPAIPSLLIGSVLGIGAGAHSFDGATRSWNLRDLDDYLRRVSAYSLPERARFRQIHEGHGTFMQPEERRFVIVTLQRTVVGMLGSSEAMYVCRS